MLKKFILPSNTAVCFLELMCVSFMNGLPFNPIRGTVSFPGEALLPYLSRQILEGRINSTVDVFGNRVKRDPQPDGDYLCQTLTWGLDPEYLENESGKWKVVHYDHLDTPLRQFIFEGVCATTGPQPSLPCTCAQEYRSQFVLVWTRYGLRILQRRLANKKKRVPRHAAFAETPLWHINGTGLYDEQIVTSFKSRVERAPVANRKRKSKNKKKRLTRKIKLDGNHWTFQRFEFRSHCTCQPTRKL